MDADLEIPRRGPLPGLLCGVHCMEAGRKGHMIRGIEPLATLLGHIQFYGFITELVQKCPCLSHAPIMTDIF